MAGVIKEMIDKIIEVRAKSSTALVGITKAKLIMKGIYIDKYTEDSEDNPDIIEKLMKVAEELKINI